MKRILDLSVLVAVLVVAGCGGHKGKAGPDGADGSTGESDALLPDGIVGETSPDGTPADGGPADSTGDVARMVRRLEISPAALTLAVGTSAPLFATVEYDDGTIVDVTSQVTFTALTPTLATTSGNIVTAVAAGAATVSVTFMGTTAMVQIDVVATALSQIVVEPANPRLPVNTSLNLTASGIFANGSKQDLTGQVVWMSGDSAIATVSNTDGSRGQVTGVAAGPVVVSAAFLGVTGQTTITVTTATISSIDVTPAQPFLGANVNQQFLATAVFSDGATADVTSQATWTSGDAAILSVSNDAGHHGLAHTVAPGMATLTAKIGQTSGSTNVTVLQAGVASIKVTPAETSLFLKGTLALTATATFTDGSSSDITTSAVWSSSSDAVSVSNAAGTRGVVTGLMVGSATVSATFAGVKGQAAVTVKAATLESISVASKATTLPVGRKVHLTATGLYSDGSMRDVTQTAVWTSSDPAIASVTTAQGTAGEVTALKVGGNVTITATLGGLSDTAKIIVTDAELEQLTVTPASASVAAGKKQSFTATAHYSDASTPDVTTQVTWSVDSRTVASISNALGSQGVASGIAMGTTTVRAKLGTKEASASLTVTAPVVVFLQITPFVPSIRVGQTQAFTATAIFSNGTTRALADGDWTSSDAAVATIASTRMGATATGIAAGTTQIAVASMGLSVSTTLTVRAPVPESVAVSPGAASIIVGQNQTFQAVVIFDDGTSATIAADWSSSDTTIADVRGMVMGMGGQPRGQASGKAPGVVTITATYLGLAGTATLTVRSPTLMLLEISPVQANVIAGQTQAFQAVAIWDDGTKQNATNQTTWVSSDVSVAVISNGGMGGMGMGMGGMGMTGRGVATSLKEGTTTITGTYMGVTGSAVLTVRAPMVVRIDVTPLIASLRVGQTQQFQASAVWDDGTMLNVTAQATWTSSDLSVASISNAMGGMGGGGGAAGPRGTATALKPGTSKIQATWMGTNGSAALTVTDTKLLYVQVTPVNPSLAKGVSLSLTATAVFDDFSVANVTGQATWVSTNTAVAVVGNAGAVSSGLVTALEQGTSEVSATYLGTKGITTVTVTAATLKAIEVTPANPNAPIGGTVAFTATARYSDNSAIIITDSAVWSSSDLAVATVSNAAGANKGTATALRTGVSTIGATYMGMMGSTVLNVRKVVSIAISPAHPTTIKGGQLQLSALATYDDGSKQDVTKTATWIPANGSIVAVSNASDSRGLATGLAAGMTNVDAHFQGVTGTVLFSVTP